MKNKPPLQIAIDGPVASGCSTVARILAERAGFLYVDTGAMYRMVALLTLRNEVDPDNETAVVELLNGVEMDMRNPTPEETDGRLITVFLDGEDVSWEIRTDEVSSVVPKVAKHPQVRKILVKKQQEIASRRDVVMEGRDITYRVLPHAQLKIYLTASEDVRARRRQLEHQSKGHDLNFETALKKLKERDHQDMNRETDPLKIVDDAVVIDTSDLNINQAVDAILEKINVLETR